MAAYLHAWKGAALAIVALVAIALGAFYFAMPPVSPNEGPILPSEEGQQEDAPQDEVAAPQGEATFFGKETCLPHRDTTGPQTLECAMGLAAEDGENYSLDLSVYSPPAMTSYSGQRIKVTGVLVPVEALSSDHWQKYDMRGIIRVSSIEPAP